MRPVTQEEATTYSSCSADTIPKRASGEGVEVGEPSRETDGTKMMPVTKLPTPAQEMSVMEEGVEPRY